MQHAGNYAPLLKACSKIQFVNPSIDSLFFKESRESLGICIFGTDRVQKYRGRWFPKIDHFFRTRHIAHLIE